MIVSNISITIHITSKLRFCTMNAQPYLKLAISITLSIFTLHLAAIDPLCLSNFDISITHHSSASYGQL